MAEYLLGSKPLSLNAPSVCWAITRQQKREKEKSGLMMEQVQNPTAKKKYNQNPRTQLTIKHNMISRWALPWFVLSCALYVG